MKHPSSKGGNAPVIRQGHTASKYGTDPYARGKSPAVRDLKGKGA